MQPLLGNDGIHHLCIFRAVPFGSGERGGFFGGRGIIPACVFTRTYRIVIVVKLSLIHISSAFVSIARIKNLRIYIRQFSRNHEVEERNNPVSYTHLDVYKRQG